MKKYRLKKDFYLTNGEFIESEEIFIFDTENFQYVPEICPSKGWIFSKDFIESNREFFEEIIKKPKDVLRWDNGAVMEIPRGFSKIFDVYMNWKFEERDSDWKSEKFWVARKCDVGDYAEYYVGISPDFFLTKEEAQLECEARNTHAKLMRRIKEIDRENNWVCDWGDNTQTKYTLSCFYGIRCFSKNTINKDYTSPTSSRDVGTCMSIQARDYMMSDAVSDREFKLFLGIKD